MTFYIFFSSLAECRKVQVMRSSSNIPKKYNQDYNLADFIYVYKFSHFSWQGRILPYNFLTKDLDLKNLSLLANLLYENI